MKKLVIVVAGIAAMAVIFTVSSPSAQDKLEGIWRKTEVTIAGPNAQNIPHPQPNLWMFTAKHFSGMEVEGETSRPVQPLENATDTQKVAAWENFSARSGTYEVKGSTVTLRNLVTKDPGEMRAGNFETYESKIEGNTLLLTIKADESGPVAEQFTMKFTRME